MLLKIIERKCRLLGAVGIRFVVEESWVFIADAVLKDHYRCVGAMFDDRCDVSREFVELFTSYKKKPEQVKSIRRRQVTYIVGFHVDVGCRPVRFFSWLTCLHIPSYHTGVS